MKIFALADLHLSFSKAKPMDIFGPAWYDHHLKIAENWKNVVCEEDWVLICGDISWAMHLEEAGEDLQFIAGLPGNKVLIRGNHDYWWKGISKVRKFLPQGITAIQNDYAAVGHLAVCGTRGWNLPSKQTPEEDEKIYQREIIRAEISLSNAEKDGFREKIFMMHFPPFLNGELDAGFARLFAKYNVGWCVYGHMHGSDHKYAVEGVIEGVRYIFAAADFTDFSPVEIVAVNK